METREEFERELFFCTNCGNVFLDIEYCNECMVKTKKIK